MISTRIVSLIAAGLLAAAAGTAAAQQPPSHKVGIVDSQRVLRDSQAAKQMQATLEAEFRRREKEIAGLPANQQERRRNALVEDISLRRDDALKQFTEKANAAIRRIAVAENFDAVLFEAAYVSPRIDITARVIKALDSEK